MLQVQVLLFLLQRDVAEEQQVVLSRAAGVTSLSFLVCLDDLNKWLKLERDRQVCGREYCLEEKNCPSEGNGAKCLMLMYGLGSLEKVDNCMAALGLCISA